MTLPGNLTAITVHGTYVDLDGSAASGTVTFTANVVGNIVDTNTGTIIAPTSSPVTLDHTGSFSITLPASDDPALVPNGFSYLVTENLTSGQRSYSILLPTGTSPVNVAAIAPARPANAHVTPVEPVNPVRPEDTGTITSLASGTVTSVNGKTGDVVLGASDVGALASTGGTVTGEVDITPRVKVAGFQLPLIAPTTRKPPWRNASFTQNFQTGHGWTADGNGTASANLNDTSVFIRGTQCATVTTAGNAIQSSIGKLNGTPLDLTNKMLRLTFMIPDTTNLNYLAFYLGSSNLANYFYWKIHTHVPVAPGSGQNYVGPGEWVTVTLPWANIYSNSGAYTVSPTGVPSTTSGFTDMRLAVYDNGGGPVTYHLQSVEVIPGTAQTFPNGVVSITFDDSYQSVFNLARPLLDQYGYRGTLYTIQDALGTPNYQTLQELRDMQEVSGWEVAGHAYTIAHHNTGYINLTAQQVNDELAYLRAWQIANGFPSDNFAYPHGWYGNTIDGVSVEKIVSRYYNTARSIISELSETWTPAMSHRLRAASSISSGPNGTPVSNLTATGGPLDRCQYDASWYIICLHQITTTAPTDSTQLLQSDLGTLLAAINSRNIPVMPVGDVVRSA